MLLVLGALGFGPAIAGEACDRCDQIWVPCVRAAQTKVESCLAGLSADCRVRCDQKATDPQGVRDPTRFNTCVRDCSRRDDACEIGRMQDRRRCDTVRTLCRRKSECDG